MSIPQLRVVTYLCPSIPVEFFQNILEVFESFTGCKAILQYEWRSVGHSEHCKNMFHNNLIDLAFVPPYGYSFLIENTNIFTELLPVTPVFKHPKNYHQAPETYIDVIIHSDKMKHGIDNILALRGCRWGCFQEDSLAYGVMLDTLKEMGENVSFFGSTHRTTSHLAAVNMVVAKQVDVATIDAVALTSNRRFIHNGAKDVMVLTTFGPFAPYAIIINTRLSVDLKNKIIAALNSINSSDDRFKNFGLLKFVRNQPNFYNANKKYTKNMDSRLSHVPYY